jgi:hypothetical protein
VRRRRPHGGRLLLLLRGAWRGERHHTHRRPRTTPPPRSPPSPDDLRADVPTEGFTDAALQGRLEVLEMAKDAAVYSGGRVAPGGGGGVPVPLLLLPSALVLLTQASPGEGLACAGGGG